MPVELLIKNGADVNTKENNFWFTPLHEATNKRFIRIVRMLVEAGADVNALDKTTKSPFSYTPTGINATGDFTAALCNKKIPDHTNVNHTDGRSVVIDLSDEDDSRIDFGQLQKEEVNQENFKDSYTYKLYQERLDAKKKRNQIIEDAFEELELKNLLSEFGITREELQN